MSVQKKSLLELLFLSDIAFPQTQAELGLTAPILDTATQVPLTPFQVWEKVRTFNEVTDADRITYATPAIRSFKLLTINRALAMCPAFETEAAIAAAAGLTLDQYDLVLANLANVLENNPLTNEEAMNALVELLPVFGDADLKVYEPVENIDPASLAATEGDIVITDTVVADAAPIEDVPATLPTDAVADDAPTSEVPGADNVSKTPAKAEVIADTAAPALTPREMAMVNARARATQKVAGMIKVLAEALEDDLEGIVSATSELPANVEVLA